MESSIIQIDLETQLCKINLDLAASLVCKKLLEESLIKKKEELKKSLQWTTSRIIVGMNNLKYNSGEDLGF